MLDESLVKEAMKIGNVKTMSEAVQLALHRFVQNGRQRKLLDLHGSGGVRRNYDHKRLRATS